MEQEREGGEHGGSVPSPLRYPAREVIALHRADGTMVLRSCIALEGVRHNIVDYLEDHARDTPDRVFLAQRSVTREWETLTYADAWARVPAIAQGLIDAGLIPGQMIAILSGASIEHALVMLAGMLIGAPVVPVSPNYSLLPDARPRLEEIVATVEPALVFVQAEAPFAAIRDLPGLADRPWLSVAGGPRSAALADWYALAPGAEVWRRRDAVTADTIGKILFTSGSTGSPKGVVNTQRMLCSAVAAAGTMLHSDTPGVQVDWMPWHHTMGGNTVLHGTLHIGGSLYIDDGRPTPDLFVRTLDNLRDVSPTMMQNVPAAYALLVAALERDDALCATFFGGIERMIYAGASLPQDVWERMQALALRTTGRPVSFGSGYGTTETGPGVTITHWASDGKGEIGLPLAGMEIKLLPVEDRYEIRVRGANVTPGYYRQPALTAQAFDEEGFYRIGDLVQFVDRTNPAAGLRFAGRLSENFKLTSGSWVATGELRLAVLEACRPLITDLVLGGADRDDVRIMAWPAPGTDRETLVAALTDRLRGFNARGGGATHRVAAFRLLDEPPSIGAGETTDKGYVNQRGVLRQRALLVDDLYAATPGPGVVLLTGNGAQA